MYHLHDSLTDLYLSRNWFSRVSPAASAAGLALILSILVLVANHRRIVNRAWALALLFLGLWQGSIAAAQLFENFVFVRFATFFAGYGAGATFLLKNLIVYPRRTFGDQLRGMRFLWALLPLYWLAFITPFSSLLASDFGDPGPAYWMLTVLSMGVLFFVLVSCLNLVWRRKVVGFAGREVRALAGLAGPCCGAALASMVFGRVVGVHYVRWFSSLMLIGGCLLFTVYLVRSEIIDTEDVRQRMFLLGVRGIGCFLIGFFFVLCISRSSVSSPVIAIMYSGMVGMAFFGLPFLDHQLRVLVDWRFVSPRFREAQSAISVEAERSLSFYELHTAYSKLLQRWANTSTAVYVSEGVFSADWPAAEIPGVLLQVVFEEGWITPEILDRRGVVVDVKQEYLAEHRIGAVVVCVSPRGERLLAMFKIRDSEQPFSSRDLREARELLRQMQIGLAFAKMRQAQRSDDRLNFYGRYAPQLAHELRNGLYLQAQLLGAIADGRGETVLASDAMVGLEKIRQLDRLCGHFFSLRAVFNQPVRVLKLGETLREIVGKAKTQINAASAKTEIMLRIDASENVEILANSDMLGIALQNLLVNSAEALASVPPPRRIDVTAVMQFEKIRVLVWDNGPGMPVERCQDPFSPGLSHKKGGMGLGLSIVRDCIEAMGGTIGFRSSNRSGTCFEITLACPSSDRSDSPLRKLFLPNYQNSIQAG